MVIYANNRTCMINALQAFEHNSPLHLQKDFQILSSTLTLQTRNYPCNPLQ